MNSYTFIIFEKDGERHQWTCRASNTDNAWDLAYMNFPDAKYIEMF